MASRLWLGWEWRRYSLEGDIRVTAILVMGVAGSGKSTVGQRLSEALRWPFIDGDDHHPPANVAKMSAGIPLEDEDRWPWLRRLHELMAEADRDGRSVVIASSALKQRYRDVLAGDLVDVRVVYLRGDFDLLMERLSMRRGHFMKPQMLHSQMAALEEPDDALVLDVARPVDELVAEVARWVSGEGAA